MIDILKLIYQHPLNKQNKLGAIWRFVKWQISSRVWGGSFVYRWIDNSKLIIANGMTGATGNIYVGLMEYEDMSFLLHYLQKDDLFYDVGANVGVYTVLASKVKKAKTVCFEPLPETYEKLLDNLNINRLDNVISHNIGLSFEKSKLHFTKDKDTMNRVSIENTTNTEEVDVDTLDSISEKYGIPKIIKIDVEGFEFNVLKGAEKNLQNEELEVIILELNGSGEKFGFSDDEIHQSLQKFGFEAYTYNPFEREIIRLDTYGTHNTIYIKKSVFSSIEKAVLSSDKFKCNEMYI